MPARRPGPRPETNAGTLRANGGESRFTTVRESRTGKLFYVDVGQLSDLGCWQEGVGEAAQTAGVARVEHEAAEHLQHRGSLSRPGHAHHREGPAQARGLPEAAQQTGRGPTAAPPLGEHLSCSRPCDS